MACTMMKVCGEHGVFWKGESGGRKGRCPACGQKGFLLDITCSLANRRVYERLVAEGRSLLPEGSLA